MRITFMLLAGLGGSLAVGAVRTVPPSASQAQGPTSLAPSQDSH